MTMPDPRGQIGGLSMWAPETNKAWGTEEMRARSPRPTRFAGWSR